jgi:hypothetical protein
MTLRRIALAAALAGVIPALPSSAEAAWGVGPRLGMGRRRGWLGCWDTYRRCYCGFILRLQLSLLRVRLGESVLAAPAADAWPWQDQWALLPSRFAGWLLSR